MAKEQIRSGDISETEKRTVESIGRSWAQKTQERMRAGLEGAVKVVRDTPEYKKTMDLPSLSGQRRVSFVRYDPADGSIYVSWWRTLRTTVSEDGKRVLNLPKETKYTILYPKKPRPDYFNNLPKKIPVVELIFGNVKDSIESAIRMQRHVLEGYNPGEVASEVRLARRVIEHTDQLATRFIGEKITKERLELIGRETMEFLEEENLVDPQNPEKKKILDMLLKIPLSPNPLVARVRARAAYLAAVKRLVVGSFVVEKFNTNLQILLYERETTRWAIETAVKQVETVLTAAAFRKPGIRVSKGERSAIANILINIADGHLTLPRVRPYLKAARAAAINLVGCREVRKPANRKILGDELADELFWLTPVRELVMQGRFENAASRIEISQSILRAVLGK